MEMNLSRLDRCHDVEKIPVFARLARTVAQAGVGVPVIRVWIYHRRTGAGAGVTVAPDNIYRRWRDAGALMILESQGTVAEECL